MLRAPASYSSVIAKVRAMYGKMLSREDWEHIREIRDNKELLTFLHGHPGWSEALSSLSAADITVPSFVRALRAQVFTEYKKIFLYASRGDRAYLLFIIYKEEYREVLSALRRLITGSGREDKRALSDFFRKKSKADIQALRMAADYASVLNAIRGTIYYSTLLHAPVSRDTGLPDYPAVSVLLENRYYSAVYSFLTRKFGGYGARELADNLGLEADLLNIISILRLHRYFPGSLPYASELLIPVRRRLNNGLINLLIQAPSEPAAVNILFDTRWGRYFEGYEATMLERKFDRAMEEFSKKLLRSALPSICVAQAYLTLRGLEAEALIRVVEAIHYGVNPENVL